LPLAASMLCPKTRRFTGPSIFRASTEIDAESGSGGCA
jgi:hypothetical protein